MRITVLSLVVVLLLSCAAALAGNPRKAKDGDYVRIEARGTVQKSAEAVPTWPDIFVTPPNPCAAGFLFEKEMERYKFQLASARIQPRIYWKQPPPASKATYSCDRTSHADA